MGLNMESKCKTEGKALMCVCVCVWCVHENRCEYKQSMYDDDTVLAFHSIYPPLLYLRICYLNIKQHNFQNIHERNICHICHKLKSNRFVFAFRYRFVCLFDFVAMFRFFFFVCAVGWLVLCFHFYAFRQQLL